MYSNYEYIYQAAKEQNAAALLNLIQEGSCIDERQVGTQYLSAGAKLAEEGNAQAVLLLLSLGANSNLVAYGAAKGRQNELLEQVKAQYPIDINWLAFGAAEGGFIDDLETHLAQNANLNWAALGAALGKHLNVFPYLKLANSGWIYQGLFLGKHDAYNNQYNLRIEHKLRVDIEEFTSGLHGLVGLQTDFDLLALGAAVGGRIKLAESYRLHHNINVNIVAAGAAYSGHKTYAEYLRIKHGADANIIACNAAKGGNRNYAEWLRTNHFATNVNLIAERAALGGHKDYAEYLRVACNADPAQIVKGAARGGDHNYCDFLLTLPNIDPNLVAANAAQGGHRIYAEKIRQQYDLAATEIAKKAITGGHSEYSELLRIKQQVDSTELAEAAVLAGYTAYAEFLRIECNANLHRIYAAARFVGNVKYLQQLDFLMKLKAPPGYGTTISYESSTEQKSSPVRVTPTESSRSSSASEDSCNTCSIQLR